MIMTACPTARPETRYTLRSDRDCLLDTPEFGSITSVPDGAVGDLDKLHVVGAGFCLGVATGLVAGSILLWWNDPNNSDCGGNSNCEDNATCHDNDTCGDNSDCTDNDDCCDNPSCTGLNVCNNGCGEEGCEV